MAVSTYKVTQDGMNQFQKDENMPACWAFLGMGLMLIAAEIEKLTNELREERGKKSFG
jgi:hypothetical protein